MVLPWPSGSLLIYTPPRHHASRVVYALPQQLSPVESKVIRDSHPMCRKGVFREGAPTGGPRRTSCVCRASRFWRPGVISRHSFTLSVISWCQSTDLMEYIKMDQVPFNFMKVEPSHDGPDYSRLTKPEPSPSSGGAVPTRTHVCWPPGPK